MSGNGTYNANHTLIVDNPHLRFDTIQTTLVERNGIVQFIDTIADYFSRDKLILLVGYHQRMPAGSVGKLGKFGFEPHHPVFKLIVLVGQLTVGFRQPEIFHHRIGSGIDRGGNIVARR